MWLSLEPRVSVGMCLRDGIDVRRRPPASAEADASPPVRFIVSALILGLSNVFSITW